MARPGRFGARLAIGLGFSVALHLAVLMALRPADAAPAQARPAVALRLIPAAAQPTLVGEVRHDAKAAPQPQKPVTAAEPIRPLGPIDLAQQTPATVAPLAAPIPDSMPGNAVEFNDSLYVSADALSIRPSALGTIGVEHPDTDIENKPTRVVLTLFINERGRVDLVQFESSGTPTRFSEAARNAFARATFTPGRIDDQSVKSQLKVEVNFDSIDADL